MMPSSIRPIIHHQDNKQGSPFYMLDDSDVSDDDDSSTSSYERLPPLTHAPRHSEEDALPPIIAPSDSVETYDSANSSTKLGFDDYVEGDELEDGEFATKKVNIESSDHAVLPEDGLIPAHLPYYDPIPFHDHPVHPTTPKLFSDLFPTMDRLSILHDDFTADGNMNLRIETPVVLPKSRREQPAAFQLFHLRMHDLPRREFSLRRYCRDSGREVCCSKRLFTETKARQQCDDEGEDDGQEPQSRPGVWRRSTTRMLHSVKTPFQRASNSSSLKRPNSRRSQSSTMTSSTFGSCNKGFKERGTSSTAAPAPFLPIIATDTIKLEFSNYARVDVSRHSSSAKARSSEVSYDFEWWGHTYSWKRHQDPYTGAVTYHLVRDGNGKAIAHMVPKTRGIEEERVDWEVGGWVKPMRMWVSDGSVFDGLTDVADVIMATGLIALVDDSIRTRWPVMQARPGPPVKSYTEGETKSKERALLPRIFHRRKSEQMGQGGIRQRRVSAY